MSEVKTKSNFNRVSTFRRSLSKVQKDCTDCPDELDFFLIEVPHLNVATYFKDFKAWIGKRWIFVSKVGYCSELLKMEGRH